MPRPGLTVGQELTAGDLRQARRLREQLLSTVQLPTVLSVLLITLDDLSLDAANGSVFLLAADAVAKGPSPDVSAVHTFSAGGASCNGIKLIFHATMRLMPPKKRLSSSR